MTPRKFISAASVEEAMSALSEDPGRARVVAGATWLMRAPLRGEKLPDVAVSVTGIAELRHVELADDHLSIGACVTHAELAEALADTGEFRGLAEAAGRSANPAIRSVATVGGNLCSTGFAAADLVPALLALDAEVEYRAAGGPASAGLEEFLRSRGQIGPVLVTRIGVRRGGYRTAHARLPLRKAGDYPVAIVSARARPQPDGTLRDVVIAVGSVEATPRRWHALEAAVEGRMPEDPDLRAIANELAAGFSGRDGIEAPGWYRVQVLPVLVRRAFDDLRLQGRS